MTKIKKVLGSEEAIPEGHMVVEATRVHLSEFHIGHNDHTVHLEITKPQTNEAFRKLGYVMGFREVDEAGVLVDEGYIPTSQMPSWQEGMVWGMVKSTAVMEKLPPKLLAILLKEDGSLFELLKGEVDKLKEEVLSRNKEVDKKPFEFPGWELQHKETGMRIAQGDVVGDPNDDQFEVVGGTPPHKPESTGRVVVNSSDGNGREFFPSVFGLVWVAVKKA